jgi:uridine kinase
VITIGIAGGTGAGKTSLARAIVAKLGKDRVLLLSQDSYTVPLSHLTLEERARENFDHPDIYDHDLLQMHLRQLRQGVPVEMPVYDFANHTRSVLTEHVTPKPVLVLEGIHVLTEPGLRAELDLKIFMDADPGVRILRRVIRDAVERGYSLEYENQLYLTTARPMHDRFVEPCKQHADVIVSGEREPNALLALILHWANAVS